MDDISNFQTECKGKCRILRTNERKLIYHKIVFQAHVCLLHCSSALASVLQPHKLCCYRVKQSEVCSRNKVQGRRAKLKEPHPSQCRHAVSKVFSSRHELAQSLRRPRNCGNTLFYDRLTTVFLMYNYLKHYFLGQIIKYVIFLCWCHKTSFHYLAPQILSVLHPKPDRTCIYW